MLYVLNRYSSTVFSVFFISYYFYEGFFFIQLTFTFSFVFVSFRVSFEFIFSVMLGYLFRFSSDPSLVETSALLVLLKNLTKVNSLRLT